ncbi:MAG: hypothetical protein MUC29_03895 [Pyrinomonadaceae bacterium]|nr:hypothetical protein [Pyrinomonadaceae bacterium]
MSARDLIHNSVKNALIRDGWKITHDPYPLKIGSRDLFIDIGAEQVLAAEKDNQKIAVEIKSFLGKSLIDDAQDALGQLLMYKSMLEKKEPDRKLFLAITNEVFENNFFDELTALFTVELGVNLIIFDDEKEEIIKWSV